MVDERPLEAGAGAESFPTDSGTRVTKRACWKQQAELVGAL